ncbi:MAG: asparagine synthase [Okeania sp. SIO2B9]|nr:asparagine synthase [Okeania sp. SIO2B9]
MQRKNLTYLSDQKLLSMTEALKGLNAKNIEGDIYEFGVALGGSAILLSSLMGAGRRFHGYDLFGMIPAPGEKDAQDTHDRYEVIKSGQSKGLNGDPYYGYEENLYQKVVDHFDGFGLPVDGQRISLHKGLFEDSLRLAPETKIALAHIDCDWYDPVTFCLVSIKTHMVPGGMVIIDDYNDYQGCKDATDAFLAQTPNFTLRNTRPHAVLVRNS